MATRVKRLPAGGNNGQSDPNMIALYDLNCSICHSIFIEPVTLPCNHIFCLCCFNETVENNALACPLCRTRIGSWLRISRKQNKLINTKLWEFLKNTYKSQIEAKLKGTDIPTLEVNNQILSAPGEIKSEYEKEMRRVQVEQKLLEEKQFKESEKLIREIQDQERRNSEKLEMQVHQDELVAKELWVKLQKDSVDPDVNTTRLPNAAGQDNNCMVSLCRKNPSESFYDYFASNGSTAKNINQVTKPITKRKSPSKSPSINPWSSSPPSPELISTAGKCGRFIKKFLSTTLWGSTVSLSSSVASKPEPKVWEPQTICAGHSLELSVNEGIKEYHGQAQSSSCDEYRCEEGLAVDTVSEDSLTQELCYFKPLHVEPVNRFLGKLKRISPVKPADHSSHTQNEKSLDLNLVVDGLERLKGPQFWRQGPATGSFVCLVQVPLHVIKARQPTKTNAPDIKTDTDKTNLYHDKDDLTVAAGQATTPRKAKKASDSATSPRNKRAARCPVSGSDQSTSNHVLTRSRRSTSSNLSGAPRTFIRNGHCGGKLATTVASNGCGQQDTPLLHNGCGDTHNKLIADPALIAEQRHIEDMIAQERKDFAFAKKLQRQLCRGDYVSTGFTVRTAKKQTTLRDMLPVAKKMKV